MAFVTLSHDETTNTTYIDKSYNELENLVLVEKKLVFCFDVWYEADEEPAGAFMYVLGDFYHNYENESYSVAFYRLGPNPFGLILYAIDPDAPMQDPLPESQDEGGIK